LATLLTTLLVRFALATLLLLVTLLLTTLLTALVLLAALLVRIGHGSFLSCFQILLRTITNRSRLILVPCRAARYPRQLAQTDPLRCPLYPQERTCAVHWPMSALGQKRIKNAAPTPFARNLRLAISLGSLVR